jgi:ResB-like family
MARTNFPAASHNPLRSFGASPPGRRLKRLFSVFASLQLAVVLLSLFTACLAGATLLESRYSARIAQDLVYRAWWFALLLALLAGNVLCAALKKYPWKKYQTGFLITHAGLLVLVLGGLLTALFGVEGQMILIDTADPAIQARFGLGNQTNTLYLTNSHKIEVLRLKKISGSPDTAFFRLLRAFDRGEDLPEEERDSLGQGWTLSFDPGPFAWHSDMYLRRELPWELRFLSLLASPWPSFSRDLDGRATLTVKNFYPHAEDSPHSREGLVPRNVRPGAEAPAWLAPALRCRLTVAGQGRDFWVGMYRGSAKVSIDDDLYLVRYRPDTRPVDFTLTLQRTRQVKDPGTDRPAWFQSDVRVTCRKQGREECRDHSIYMNHPLDEGLYKVYQANYRALVDPSTLEPVLDRGRQVSLSGLTVAHDPGLWFKYAGALTVVLGIATMFYMKAYFFKRRGG